ncbi:MAG: hypothetical protein HFH36_11160 [Lachnospiraceae bacterium]|nr:hypothetical protein [Lachnospiraceae bacterium]
MNFEDEKDYIMRIIKEAVNVLFSFLLGKTYVSVEQELQNHYEVSGQDLNGFLEMIDSGDINEAENNLLTNMNYQDKHEVLAASLFYHYVSEKDSRFLRQHNYSKEEALDGLQQLMKKAGYDGLTNIWE